ncbi:Tat binding protein 1-interacting protein-domain-containing protein [Tribonema minus]|uniref:Tat binding protein 1-interacting protein-domain-containing protein n=1 Tax=Tribonema minus TaxID=303371 RepID=A0A836CJ02_9STRA|nr:Tat binding protein 1-interacting protein-domain-containing protein [Tribonema minus]
MGGSSDESDAFVDEESEDAVVSSAGDESDDSDDFEDEKPKKKAPAKTPAKAKPKASTPKQKKASAKATAAAAAPKTTVSRGTPPMAEAKPAAARKRAAPSADGNSATKKPATASRAGASAGAVSAAAVPTAAAAAAAAAPAADPAAAAVKKTPEQAVRDYMRQTNRPYSIVNIFDNLHRKIPRTMVQKILDQLVQSGELLSKEYGKAVIYYCNQTRLEADLGELQALAAEEKDLSAQLQRLQQQLQQMQSDNAALAAQPADDALEEELTALQNANDAEDQRLAGIRGAQGAGADPAAMSKARTHFNKLRQVWVDRKNAAREWVDRISDGMEKKPKVVMDLMGVDPDADTVVPPKMSLGEPDSQHPAHARA